MYQALYRKYRPKNFEDVVGQKVIIKTLVNSILNNKITHAYLFAGPRGTGKTSIAKILAKIVNCESPNGVIPCDKCVNCTQINNKQNTDVIEIDAASNNGVDEIRELRDKVNLVPSFGKYKIYIIDEVHMLTQAAFNALLKTLEEPPKHIIFILATTEPHKIPATILSRCQRFDFKKISTSDIKLRLKYICEKENISIEDNALDLIAILSDGGMRDSIGLLDQLTAYTTDKITVNDVHDVYGTITDEQIYEFLIKIFNNNLKDSFNLIEEYDNSGKNLVKIMENIINFLKNILIYYNASEYFQDEKLKKMYSDICDLVPENKIYKIIDILLDSIKSSKTTNNVKLIFELSIIKILELEKSLVIENKIPEEIQIFEEKKKIETKAKIENKKLNNDIKQKLEELKQIRINNTLSKFEKKELNKFKNEMDQIKELLMDPLYSPVVSLILDGELKAKGDKNLIFVYKIKNLEENFNSMLIEIQNAFYQIFNEKYLPIAVTEDEWEIIKTDFNRNLKENKKNYEYREEKNILENIFNENKKNDTIIEPENEIEATFSDMIVYN